MLMERIAQDGVCPFCAEHVRKYHPKPILKETDHWFFTENMSPYVGTKHHFIFIYKPSHITTLSELPPEGWTDLHTILDWATAEYAIAGGTFALRFGASTRLSNSVAHLHAHFLEPDIDDPEHPGVKFPVSKSALKQALGNA